MTDALAILAARMATIVVTHLHHAGIVATVTDRIASARVLTLALRLRDPADLAKTLRMGETLATALGADNVRMARHGSHVLAEVTHPSIPFRPLAAETEGNLMHVPLGMDTLGRHVMLDLTNSATPHALISGTTGSGKTIALGTLCAALCRQNKPTALRMLVIDGKGEWTALSGLPHLLAPPILDPGEAARALDWVVGELDGRAAGWNHRIVVIVDEVQHVLAETGGARGTAARQLARLTAQGRSRGISVVLATQHPTAEVLGGSLAAANLPARLCGRVVNAAASTLATGHAGMDAHKLAGAGDFLMVVGANVRRFQVAVADLDDLPRGDGGTVDFSAPESLHPAHAPHPVTDPQVAWACQHGRWWGEDDYRPAGVDRIRQNFAPIGQTRAGRIRDAAVHAIATGGYRPYRVPENAAPGVEGGPGRVEGVVG